MTTSKVFNPETLLHYTEQDAELASQLASMGRDDMPDFLEKAEEQLNREQFSEARRSIHSLKGVAGALGAEKLYDHSLNCEILLKEGGSPEEIRNLLNLLHSEIETLLSDPLFLRYSDDRTL